MPVLGNTHHRPLSEAPGLWRLIERAAVSAVGMGAWRARAMVVGRWYRMTGCAAEEPWDTGPSAHTAGLAGPVGQSCWNRLAALSGRTKDTVTMSPLVRLPARRPPSAPPAHAMLQRAFCASEQCFIWIWQAPQRPMHAPRATRAKADADARMGCALPRCCLTAHHKDSSACDAPPPPSMRSRRAPAGQQLCGAAHRSARRAQQPRDRAHAGVLRKEGIRL